MATAFYILSVWFLLNAVLAAGLYFRPKRKSNSLHSQDNPTTELSSIVIRHQPDGDQPKRNPPPPAIIPNRQSPALLRVVLFGLFIR